MNQLLKIALGLLICSTLFNSCKEDCKNEHGCLDSNATNYNHNAVIDNNSCCYNCYYGENNMYFGFVGEYCGNDVNIIENDTYDIIAQHHVNSSGETVFPATPGAIGVFNDVPTFIEYKLEITCGISLDTISYE